MSSSDQLALGATSLERVLQQRSVDWDEAGRPADARLILALVHRHGCSRGVVAHLLDLTVDEVNRLLVDALRGAA